MSPVSPLLPDDAAAGSRYDLWHIHSSPSFDTIENQSLISSLPLKMCFTHTHTLSKRTQMLALVTRVHTRPNCTFTWREKNIQKNNTHDFFSSKKALAPAFVESEITGNTTVQRNMNNTHDLVTPNKDQRLIRHVNPTHYK